MDIWRWVHEKESELADRGEHRLVEIISDIPSYTVDDRHDKVDLIYPEGLSIAKRLGDRWVELFLRHWHLQSQVLRRSNARGMLNEAIDLLDFSHQEDTKGCPQRICVVQDLANYYATQDYKGYTAERISVARETLAEIDAVGLATVVSPAS